MQLILQETVVGLGKLGDVVKVKAGYGRNYLVPYGKALPATQEHIEMLGKMREQLEAKEAEKLAAANKRADSFREKAVSIAMHASEEGRLYGSLAPADVLVAFAELGHELEKSEILMPGSVREIGDHEITLQFHPEVAVQVVVTVTRSEDDSKPVIENAAEPETE
jgi:large subunit ribosomal protein L9